MVHKLTKFDAVTTLQSVSDKDRQALIEALQARRKARGSRDPLARSARAPIGRSQSRHCARCARYFYAYVRRVADRKES